MVTKPCISVSSLLCHEWLVSYLVEYDIIASTGLRHVQVKMIMLLQEKECDETGGNRDAEANDDNRLVTSLVTSASDDAQMAERRVTRSTIRQQQNKCKLMMIMILIN